MPDQDLLPRGRVLHPAPQPPAGLGDVLARAGRRRRHQQAGMLATVAAACAAVFAVTMATGGAVDSLREMPATHTGHDVPLEAPRVLAPDISGPATVVGSVGSAGQQQDDSARQPATSPERQDPVTSGSNATAQQNTSGGEVGPPHSITAYKPSRGCTGAGPVAPTGWCGYYDGATSGHPGQRVELAETLCRLPGQGAGTLETDNGQQAEFSVVDKDAYTRWLWSKGHRFSKKGTAFSVAAGTCVRWHVRWNVSDAAGRPLAAGAYSLGATPFADPPGDTHVNAQADFITFTVL
jgi:hypothetical protein